LAYCQSEEYRNGPKAKKATWKRLAMPVGLKVKVVITDGSQPVGRRNWTRIGSF